MSDRGETAMSEIDFSCRAELVEEMDKPDCDQTVLYATLRRFEMTNLIFTRYRTLLRRHILSEMQLQPDRVYRLTDLGAGGCDVARWLIRVCRRKNLKIAVRAIEQDQRTIRYARLANAGYPEIEVIEADACNPDCWGEPDFLFAQHLLHHLPDAVCVQLLKALDDAAPRRYVISDILRSRAAYYAFKNLARVFAGGTFIAADGSISIRRGFVENEIRALIKHADLRNQVSVYSLSPYRLAVVGGAI